MSPLGYAFTFTLFGAWFLIAGLLGFRLDRHGAFAAATRWTGHVIWWQVGSGVVMACVAAWFWRKGLIAVRSNVYVPELAGRDPAAPRSRRIDGR